MITNNEVISIALNGFVFSMLFSVMIFLQKNNANKNIVDNRVYMLPWLNSIPAFISCLLLIKRIKIYNTAIIGIVVFCILLTAVLYILFYNYDRKSLKDWYSDNKIYTGAPKYFLFFTALVSAITMSVILGWAVLVFAVYHP